VLPDPLHPAVVHFPIVLAFLLPLFAIGALVAIRKGARPLRAWSLPLAVGAALTLSSWVAVQTGEAQDARVERVVGDAPLETHEDAAELFLTLSGVLLLVSTTGLVRGVVGRAGRIVGTVGAIALVAAAAQVGHSGGELVYRHGAASAYVPGPNGVAGGAGNPANDRVANRNH
jgi:uncharacterized membrane protein